MKDRYAGDINNYRRYRLLCGATGRHVPIYFLDTDVPENTPDDRKLTRALYTGNSDWRIKREAVLGIGGRRMLRDYMMEAYDD